ncbi:MAG: glycosyltransferase family A protein, partial [Calditrichaceae bacterium]
MSERKYNFYSLIIPSFNRAEEVDVLLASLSKLDFSADRFEVIIADDGSTDNTESIVDSYKKRIAFPLYYYTQKNQGPGAARNLGMKNAKGDFFIFVDSDVSVPCYWLANIDTALNKEKADAFGGPDTFRDDFPALLK